jgi:hypothetical protein
MLFYCSIGGSFIAKGPVDDSARTAQTRYDFAVLTDLATGSLCSLHLTACTRRTVCIAAGQLLEFRTCHLVHLVHRPEPSVSNCLRLLSLKPSEQLRQLALSENLERPNRRAGSRRGAVRLDSRNARQRIHENLELARLSSVSTRD